MGKQTRPAGGRARGFAVAGLLLALGCSEPQLRPINPTVAVAGRYCTNDSQVFTVPIRVLLIVDTSQSMEVNDPTGFRGKAARQLVTELQGKGGEVSFAFVHFDSAARALTPGFSRDRAVLDGALLGLNRIEGFTNYLSALQEGRALIREDLEKTRVELEALEAKGEDVRYKRPWYFIVFLSDGIPRMPGGVLQSTESILAEVELLAQVPEEVAGITLNTAFLGAQDDVLRPPAEALLGAMATAGRGRYTSFSSGDRLDFTVFDFEIKRLFQIKQLLVYNRTSVLAEDAGAPLPDTDSDGLSDEQERELATDPLARDTDGDGLGDGYELRVALKPTQPSSVCTTSASRDSDKDGLNDCEETFLSLDPQRFDTDGDLFPDALEVLSGANAADSKDGEADLDFDGVPTGRELRERTKVNRADGESHDHYGLRYALTETFSREKGSYCYDYRVDHIGLVKAAPFGDRPAGVNELVIEFIEVPVDRPEELFSLNRLVLPVEYAAAAGASAPIAVESRFLQVASQEVKKR